MNVHKFFFEHNTDHFFSRSLYFFYVTAIYFIWQHDWSIYQKLAPIVFSAPGSFNFLGKSFPSPYTILAVQILGTLACLLSIFVPRVRALSALIVFLSLFFLDTYSNGFGFINVQIHLIWFSLILFLGFKFNNFWFRSFLFRLTELIIILAYFQSFLAKIVVAGPQWALDGTTLQIAILRQGLIFGLFLADWNIISKILSVITLLFEGSFIFYFLLPPKYKKILLGIGISFHFMTLLFLGIGFVHLWILSAIIIVFGYHKEKVWAV